MYIVDQGEFAGPDVSTIDRHIQQIVAKDIDMQNLVAAEFVTCIPRIRKYRERNQIPEGKKTPSIVCTDACFFNKNVRFVDGKKINCNRSTIR